MSRLFSGVRSSCDMFARNSDLYRDDTASCSARSASARPASSISTFFTSIARLFSASSAAFSSSSVLVLRSFSCWPCSCPDRSCSSSVSRRDWVSSSSVRELAMIVLTVTPIVSVIWSRKARCTSVNGLNEASSITASTRSSNSTGSTTTSAGGAAPSEEEIRT